MKPDKIQKQRRIVQSVSFILSLGFLAFVIVGGKYVIHQACPYAMVCFGASGWGFLKLGGAVMAAAIIFGFAVLVYSMFRGRRFCAWLCPLGTVQEFIYSLRSRKYRAKHQTPFYVDRKLAWLKFSILLATAILTVLGLNYVFIRLCPFYGISLLPGLIAPGLIVLGLIIIKSWFGSREWCRFLCPYAALLNIFQFLGEVAGIRRSMVKRNLERCTDCGVCMLFCPMNIEIATSEYVRDRNCIHCDLCAQNCPKPGTYSEERECDK